MSRSPGLPPLTYAAPNRPPSSRAWRVALWLSVIYLFLLGILLGLQVRPMLYFARFITGAPPSDPYVIGILLMQTVPPAIILANVLAVVGYSLGARGRSPRRPFLIYVLVQTALITLVMAAAAYVVWRGPFSFVTPTGSSSVGVPAGSLILIPLLALALSLPLVALVVPQVRRACFSQVD